MPCARGWGRLRSVCFEGSLGTAHDALIHARLLEQITFYALRFCSLPASLSPGNNKQVWDIAAMRVDAGLVLDKLSEVTCGPGTVPPQVGEALPGLHKLSGQPETAGSMDPAAFGEMAAGLRWIWVCLGRDSGLSAEIAALESFADHGVTFHANGDNGLS